MKNKKQIIDNNCDISVIGKVFEVMEKRTLVGIAILYGGAILLGLWTLFISNYISNNNLSNIGVFVALLVYIFVFNIVIEICEILLDKAYKHLILDKLRNNK